jgi:hypothetical protein
LEIVIDIGTISRWNDVAPGELLASAASGPLGGGGGGLSINAPKFRHTASRHNGTDKLVVEKVQGGVVFFSATEPNDWKAFLCYLGKASLFTPPPFLLQHGGGLSFAFLSGSHGRYSRYQIRRFDGTGGRSVLDIGKLQLPPARTHEVESEDA